MPYLVSTSFCRLLEKLSIPGDQGKTAHTRAKKISELLADKFTILDIFPTGSAVRGTGLKNRSDIDVMLVLHYSKHLKGKTPSGVLEMVRDALSNYNAKIVKKNGQAVTLYFATWPQVDIVPTKMMSDNSLHIPDMNSEQWIATNPPAHDRRIASLSNRGRQLVQIVKQWNLSHSGYFQSFHVEQVALAVYLNPSVAWEEDEWPWTLKKFFEKAIEMTEPTTSMSDSYDVDDWSELRGRLRRAQELSFDAWAAVKGGDHESAIERLAILLGSEFPSYG